MRLLVTTQAVDLDDPVLSFFHRWLEEFATNSESVHVICLKEGRHELPKNVFVHSLGKSTSSKASQDKGVRVALRIQYILRLLRYSWKLRKDYDAVFVHMNPEYLLVAGWLWQALRKRVALWYIHPRASGYLKRGMRHAHVIFSATEKSFPLITPKLMPVGLGVDTDFFQPKELYPSAELRIMCAARIAPVKKVECMIDAAEVLTKIHTPFLFDYYGEGLPRDKSYAEAMRKRAERLSAWIFKGAQSAEGIRAAYQTHDVHINATETGSFDKAVFEAMACGCISIASNRALADIIPKELLFEEGDPVSLAKAIEHVARLPREDRAAMRIEMRRIAVEQYSLSNLIMRILDGMKYGIA